jgi:hypothetical protein
MPSPCGYIPVAGIFARKHGRKDEGEKGRRGEREKGRRDEGMKG